MVQDLKASLERLYALRAFGIKPGLSTELALLERLGNPHLSIAAIHVAGTNGKGSVCAMLDAVLREAGLKVGLYTSPHLIRFHERIRVNGQEISDADLGELFDRMELPAKDAGRQSGSEVTFFEFTTALAFEYFRQKGIRLVVLETGLGGRLDATNVVTPLLSIITRIGLEHTQYLGATLEAIAGEKAGIIKPGRPVVCGAMPEEALAVMRKVAGEKKARLVNAPDVVSVRRAGRGDAFQKISVASGSTDYGAIRLPLLGRHQWENCATTVAALEELATLGIPQVGAEAVKLGLSKVSWPGRLQVISQSPLMLLDGAHNPDAGRALAGALKEIAGKRPVGLVCGMCVDKDNRGFLDAFAGLVRRCWTVPIRSERCVAPSVLAGMIGRHGWAVTEATVPDALREAGEWARTEKGIVCIAGSLFLVGEVLEIHGYGQQERGW